MFGGRLGSGILPSWSLLWSDSTGAQVGRRLSNSRECHVCSASQLEISMAPIPMHMVWIPAERFEENHPDIAPTPHSVAPIPKSILMLVILTLLFFCFLYSPRVMRKLLLKSPPYSQVPTRNLQTMCPSMGAAGLRPLRGATERPPPLNRDCARA